MSRAIIGMSVVVLVFGGMSAKAQTPKSSELKVLDRMVGSWRVESVSWQGQRDDEEQSTGAVITTWSLQGQYIELRVTDSDGKEELLELITYDSDAGVYKVWAFSPNSPKPAHLTMRWNESKKTLTGKVDLGNGITMQTTLRFIGKDRYKFTTTTKDASGNVLVERKGKVFRKKKSKS